MPADRVSFLQKIWCCFISGQNFGFLSNMTTAFITKKLYMWLKFENYGDKWKAEIFLLGIISLLMWNLLSSTTSCSLYMCQISGSLVSVLVFELFMCVAADSKCYQDGYIVISCSVLHLNNKKGAWFRVVYMLIFQQIIIGETNRSQRFCDKMIEVILK